MSSTSSCPFGGLRDGEWLGADWRQGREEEFFWLSGVAAASVGLVGLLGNSLTLLVLARSCLTRKVFYKLLAALAAADLVFLLSYGCLLAYRELSCRPTDERLYAALYPVINFSLVGSIYITLAVSLETDKK